MLVLISGATAAVAADWKPADGPLLTRWAKDVTPARALPEYPRPQLSRPEWQSLNGLWDYAVTGRTDEAPRTYAGSILVPFPLESALSGVMKRLDPKERLWYHRRFVVPKEWAGRRVLLHFGAVDWETTVSVNGRELGGHRGGYDAFTYDVTRALKDDGPQDVLVSVFDPTDAGWQLRGKQTLHPGGAAYTACSGIWQTVWLEPVAYSAVETLRMVPDLNAGLLHLTVTGRTKPGPMTVTATAFDGKDRAGEAHGVINAEITPETTKNLVDWYKATSTWGSVEVDLPIKNVRPWTPDDPFLYDLTVELKDGDDKTVDTVRSYFGMRTIAVGRDAKGAARPLLNGKPIMLPGALDQGYWPNGVYTAPTDEALRFDVEAAKRLGLAAVRKHLKVEPDRYYYWTDKLGLLVLQDMPSGNEGDPFTDAPTSPEAAAQCETEMRALIRQRWNHPSILCWELFNEGWGQYDTFRHAKWAKELDPTRLIDEASGFPRHGGGDVCDTHGGNAPKDPKRISIDTETAGFGLTDPEHRWPGKPWATGTYDPKTGGEGRGDLCPVDDASRRWYTGASGISTGPCGRTGTPPAAAATSRCSCTTWKPRATAC